MRGESDTGRQSGEGKRSHTGKVSDAGQQWILLGCFFLILLAAHLLFVMPGSNDDAVYQDYWRDYELWDFLKMQYAGWTSRLLVELAVMLCTGAPSWVWYLVNIALILAFVWNAADLFGLKEKRSALILFFVLIWAVPLETLCDAGWINTTANYLWVLCLGSFALRPLKHLCLGERCAPWEWAVCPLCTLYGADMEQMAAILLGSYLACGGYLLLRRQKLSAFYFVQLSLIAFSVVFALTAPGNALRTAAEIRNSFPGFAELNFGEKLAMGYLKAGQYYFAAGFEQKSFLFPLLSGVLFLGVLKKYRAGKGAWRIAVAAVPFAFYWLVGQLGNRLLKQNLVVRCGHIIALIGGNRQIPGVGPYSWGQVSLQLLVYLALTGCVAVGIYFLHGKSGETLLELTVLGAGFCSLILMGFTPTVYASGDRTALYCSAAMLIVVMRNLLLLFFSETESGGET